MPHAFLGSLILGIENLIIDKFHHVKPLIKIGVVPWKCYMGGKYWLFFNQLFDQGSFLAYFVKVREYMKVGISIVHLTCCKIMKRFFKANWKSFENHLWKLERISLTCSSMGSIYNCTFLLWQQIWIPIFFSKFPWKLRT